MYYWAQFTGPLKLIQKYINCLDVQKLFHSTTMYILYLVNTWFVSFNWHYLYLIILHSLQYWHSITQLPPHCGAVWQAEKFLLLSQFGIIHCVISNFKSITSVCSQDVLVFKWITLVTSVSQGDLWFSYNFHIDIIYLVVAIYKIRQSLNIWKYEASCLHLI